LWIILLLIEIGQGKILLAPQRSVNKPRKNKMKKLGTVGLIALTLVIIGGLNWGLVGFFSFNLVTALFGNTMLTNIVYDLVGISALYIAFGCFMGKE
jgi:hypothetical protein